MRVAAFVLFIFTACGDRIEGTAIDLIVSNDAPLDGAVTDSNGLSVAQGWLTITSAQLIECPSLARRIVEALSPVGSAWAHGVASPTKIAVPHVLPLEGLTGRQTTLGTFAAPPGQWCAVHVILSPADADAVGLGDSPMNGRTLMLDLAASVDTVGLTFTLAEPIALSEARLHHQVSLSLTPGTWLPKTRADAPDLPSTASMLLSLTPR